MAFSRAFPSQSPTSWTLRCEWNIAALLSRLLVSLFSLQVWIVGDCECFLSFCWKTRTSCSSRIQLSLFTGDAKNAPRTMCIMYLILFYMVAFSLTEDCRTAWVTRTHTHTHTYRRSGLVSSWNSCTFLLNSYIKYFS